MSYQVQLKHSSVRDKAPQPGDLIAGELAVNLHQDTPALYLKDAAGVIRKVAGAGSVGAAPDASDTVKGIVELATTAEVTAGLDAIRAITPAALKASGIGTVPNATDTARGIVELATAAEVTAGLDDTRAVTPASLKAGFTVATVPDATDAIKGIVELATAAETTTGTDTGRAVTPAGVKAGYVTKAGDTLTGPLAVASGTAGVPGLAFAGDPNTGIYSPAADQVAVTTAGAERLSISAAGRVTIPGSTVGTPAVLVDGATITPDFGAATNFTLTLGGNQTLANPTNLVAGQSGCLVITNTTFTITYGTYWKFPGGTKPAIALNGVSVLTYYVVSPTAVVASLLGDVK